MLLDRWCAWAQRCRLAPFVKLARTIRTHRAGTLVTIEHGLTNGRVEGLNNRVGRVQLLNVVERLVNVAGTVG